MGASSLSPPEADALARDITNSLGRMRQEWAVLAQNLHAFVEGKAWAALGFTSLREFLQQPEIDIGERYVYQLIEAYQTFVITKGVTVEALSWVDMSKARAVLPAVRRGDVEVEQALADAQTLSRADLEREYRAPNRPLDPSREPVWETCPHCGSRYPVKATDHG